jgi:hypothetical protein
MYACKTWSVVWNEYQRIQIKFVTPYRLVYRYRYSSMTSSVECQKKSIFSQETRGARNSESQQTLTPQLVGCIECQLSSGWNLIT